MSIVMLQTISITSKWQIHIPKQARKALKLDKPGKFAVSVENNSLILTPTKSKILELAGKYASYAKKHKVNLDKVRDFIDYSDL